MKIGLPFRASMSKFENEMKKFLASIVVLVYFVVSTGFVISVHYCMDKVRSLQLGDTSHKLCGQCGMPIKDNKGCCKDKVSVVKMQVDQTAAKWAKTDFSLPAIAIAHTSFLLLPLFNTQKQEQPVAHGPPLSKQDTYLRNRVFRL